MLCVATQKEAFSHQILMGQLQLPKKSLETFKLSQKQAQVPETTSTLWGHDPLLTALYLTHRTMCITLEHTVLKEA